MKLIFMRPQYLVPFSRQMTLSGNEAITISLGNSFESTSGGRSNYFQYNALNRWQSGRGMVTK